MVVSPAHDANRTARAILLGLCSPDDIGPASPGVVATALDEFGDGLRHHRQAWQEQDNAARDLHAAGAHRLRAEADSVAFAQARSVGHRRWLRTATAETVLQEAEAGTVPDQVEWPDRVRRPRPDQSTL